MQFTCEYASPVGLLTLASDGESLTGLWIAGQKHFAATLGEAQPRAALPVFAQARAWLDSYFAGARPAQMPPLAPQGSAFERAVWALLCEIPLGRVTTYGRLAAQLNPPSHARPVGGAVGRNPISILIPCHRVLGANGGLTGYAGGLAAKEWMLMHEQADRKSWFEAFQERR